MKQHTRTMGRPVVAVINRKGGVGKTAVTSNLAAELAGRGYQVGVVDSDAQGGGHLAIVLGAHPDGGLYRLLVEGADLEHVAQPVSARVFAPDAGKHPGGITVISSDERTYRIPQEIDDADVLGALLARFASTCLLDVVLIDTGPSMSLFDGAIYDAADAFLYVTQVETLSLVGINASFEQIERRNAHRRARGLAPNRVLGIVPNMVGGLKEHYDNLASLRDAFGEALVWHPLRRLKTYPKAMSRRQAVRVVEPTGGAAQEIAQMGDEFEKAVEAWLTEA